MAVKPAQSAGCLEQQIGIVRCFLRFAQQDLKVALTFASLQVSVVLEEQRGRLCREWGILLLVDLTGKFHAAGKKPCGPGVHIGEMLQNV